LLHCCVVVLGNAQEVVSLGPPEQQG